MRLFTKCLPLAILLLSAAACALPYQSRGLMGIGYSEAEIEPGTFFLDYTGDQYHSMAMVVGHWHRRAKELCPAGYSSSERQEGSTSIGGLAGQGMRGNVAMAGGFLQYPKYAGYIHCTDSKGTNVAAPSKDSTIVRDETINVKP